ncbi:hypothetical protein GUITHDRAFT_153385 [Guillardia theta CCMP2712]|uniref:Uncharacterized protein n=1 Tax=Guillardia theta (strain CCMP2712) TaxID=905079 RepID=L1J4E8_GUITC|nr:hypothetical protein GUITHDRAFT_153385 [Guillardia theta CCMP2712]EKX43202.1 hypothetical protein GUITHDRAFT_153385 [Guillardia theta CCMP2712]|eukprot:XP_005830182.1 hypothetical protein GUITHDRAFT_153385 [Guillardia theta CCMP2712]
MVALPSPSNGLASRLVPQKRRNERSVDGRGNSKKISSSSRFYANVIAQSLKSCYQNETDPSHEHFADAHSARHVVAHKMLSDNRKRSIDPIQRSPSAQCYTGPITRSRSSATQDGVSRVASSSMRRQPSFSKISIDIPHKIDTIYELSPSPENVVMYEIPKDSAEYVEEVSTPSSRRPISKSSEAGYAVRRNSSGSIGKKKVSTPKSYRTSSCSGQNYSWGETFKVSWAECFDMIDSGVSGSVDAPREFDISRTQSFGATAMSEQFNLMRTHS